MWRSKLLSFTGRIELVHTIITKVRFWMQNFQILEASTNKINSICANLILKGGLCKVCYELLCRLKNEGGIGLKNPRDLIKSVALKSTWKVITSKNI